MIFKYKNWDKFCGKLADSGLLSIPTKEITYLDKHYIVLKHDVETNVKKALKIAQIENKYGHRGTFYVQAYLMHDRDNISMLQKMQQMGHEISYHYDVMDSCGGNLEIAIQEFSTNKQLFENNGFNINTVCQHGNPVVERVGYTSNRDFFRSDKVRQLYPHIYDVMVNQKGDVPTEFDYYSDAGRVFKKIYDPLNNDIVNSDDKNIPFDNLDQMLETLDLNNGNIISTHPHRWCNSSLAYITKTYIFKTIRTIANFIGKIPFAKKIMSRYYYLAKKI